MKKSIFSRILEILLLCVFVLFALVVDILVFLPGMFVTAVVLHHFTSLTASGLLVISIIAGFFISEIWWWLIRRYLKKKGLLEKILENPVANQLPRLK